MKTSIRHLVMPAAPAFSLFSMSALAQGAKTPSQGIPSTSAPAMSNHSQKNEDSARVHGSTSPITDADRRTAKIQAGTSP